MAPLPPTRRLEDGPLVTGAARYLADLPTDGVLHARFVRSHVAHGVIRDIDVSAAATAPGVVAVLTAADLDLAPLAPFMWIDPAYARPPLAVDRVRFVGEPVAVVLAGSPAQADDAAELVVVELDALPPLLDPDEALADGAARAFPEHGTNEAFAISLGEETDPLDDAEIVVRGRFAMPRISASPMETNACLARPTVDGMVVDTSTQAPHTLRDFLAEGLGLSPEQVRVLVPQVGGGFGAKFHPCVEYLVICAAARAVDRPVRWVESREEHLVGCSHGRGQVQHVGMGFRRDGTITGLDLDITGDAGAYPGIGGVMPNATLMMATGPYRIPRLRGRARTAVTTTSPTIAYRGAGRPEAALALERILDLAAGELGIDRFELRRRNLLRPDEFPWTVPSGLVYDSGEYQAALDMALAAADLDGVLAEQEARRERGDGRVLGIGAAVYLDITPFFLTTEWAALDIVVGTASGGEPRVRLRIGTCSHGQGHRTTYGAVLQQELGLPADWLELVDNDTGLVARGIGSASARSVQIGGNAIVEASRLVLDEARDIAAELLEAPADDMVVVDGGLAVRGVPTSFVPWGELVTARAEQAGPDGPQGFAVELDATQPAPSFPFGVHVSVVEVDLATGRVELLRHVCVDDCGTNVAPFLVEGQQHGGAAQGVAEALLELVEYDADGSPRTASLADYLMPSAADLPPFDALRTETPTPHNPLGAKGIGQSGAIGAPTAVQNAVLDALAHLGVRHLDVPLTPERVWRALNPA